MRFLHIFKFNPYHDPKDGKFTSGGSGSPISGVLASQGLKEGTNMDVPWDIVRNLHGGLGKLGYKVNQDFSEPGTGLIWMDHPDTSSVVTERSGGGLEIRYTAPKPKK